MCGGAPGMSAIILLFSVVGLAMLIAAVVAGIGLARRLMSRWTVLGSTATSAAMATPDVLSDSHIVDSIRASDTDRQRTVTALGTHMTAGRLTPIEFDDRVTTAYDARTVGELRELLTDLPPDPMPATAATDMKWHRKS